MRADCTDTELLSAREDPACLAELARRYTPMCYAVASDFANLPREDSVQECELALLAAIHHYDPTRGASFGTYAWTCMHNRLCRMARAARRHVPIAETCAPASTAEADPEQWMEAQEALYERRRAVRHKLSGLEYRVYALYTAGNHPQEIAVLLSTADRPIGVKSINNALCRIRRKLRVEDGAHGKPKEKP